jgi:precorrin-4/cobalt-precorrin-4 C11-methyltransferase
MKVYFVGAGPGDPKLLTLKAKELIEKCGFCIYAGSLVSDEIVSLIPGGAEKYDSAGMSLDEIVDLYRQAKEKNIDVVRLHTGDPSIYGATREQMDELDRLGIEYRTIPGVSSFQAAAAALDIELTMPEKSQTIILARTAGRTPVPDSQDLSELAKSRSTLCIFLSVQDIESVVEKLVPSYGNDCPSAVVYRASWPDQVVVRGALSEIAEKTKAEGIKKTAIIIVGDVLGENSAVSKLYDKSFSHGYRKGGGAVS